MPEEDDATLAGGTHQPAGRPEITHQDLPSEIGHYAVEGLIGAGGMRQVYRGRDTRLGRSVAIKVLPASFVSDDSTLERFKREAKVLASLNHPNIATIHGFEESGRVSALVLELVEGETLAERIKRGPMSLAEAMPIFRQIAEALEVAHQQGIVHRDLKPANIKFTKDGLVKVLDFGLAKAVDSGLPGTALTGNADEDLPRPEFTTQSGMILGTAAYMSPEQSRGLEVDQRTDIWAFGCCLYECLTGRRPFLGKTISDVLAEILKSDPDFTVVPPETPSEVISLLRRCLEKEQRRRLRDIGDIAIRIEESIESSRRISTSQQLHSPTLVEPATATQRPAAWWQNTYVILIFACLAIALGYRLDDLREKNPSLGPTGEVTRISSLAVLPFDNLRKDDQLGWLSETMADAIQERLGGLDQVIVRRGHKTWNESVEAGVSEGELATALKAGALVHGKYIEVNEVLQINASLVLAAEQREIPLGMFTNVNNNVLEIQNQVAVAIAKRIRSRLSREEQTALAMKKGTDPEAYQLYRQGLHRFNSFTASGFDESEKLFQEALVKDPGYGASVARLASVPWMRTIWGFTDQTPAEALVETRRILLKHGGNVRNQDSVLAARAWTAMLEFDWKKSRQLFRRDRDSGVTDNRKYSNTATYLLVIEGRHHAALKELAIGQDLEPQNSYLRFKICQTHWRSGNFAESLRLVDEALELWPDDVRFVSLKASNLTRLSRAGEAVAVARRAYELQRAAPELMRLIVALAKAGQTEEARTNFRELQELTKSVFVDDVWLAIAEAALGDQEAALQRLDDAASGNGGFGILQLRDASMLAEFGNEPRYWAIVDRLNFPALPIDHRYHELEQGMRYGKGEMPSNGDVTIRSLAVLPFENSKPNDTTNSWVATTMRDEIRIRLGALNGLTVKTGYETLSEFGGTAEEMAAKLSVDALITGSFLLHQGQLEVRMFLVDGSTGAEKALGRHEGTDTGILGLQKEAAITIASQIRSDVSALELEQIAQANDIKPEAYIAFREGLTQLDTFTRAGFSGAIKSFEQAIKQDPSFIAPRIRLAYSHWLPMIWGTKLGTAREGFQRANAVLSEARIAFPDERSIPVAQAYFNMLSEFDWKGAKQAFDEELSVPGFDQEVHVMRCWYLLFVEGRYHEALRSVDRALAIDPDRLGYQDARAEVFAFMDNEAEALRLNQEIQDRQPDGFDWLCNIAHNLKNLQRLPEALTAAEEAVRVSGRNPSTLAVLAEIHAAMGDDAKMQTLLDELATQEKSGIFVPSTWVARVHLTKGDLDLAVSLLTSAYEKREGNSFLYHLRKMDVVRALADHRGYWDLIERMDYPRFPIDHPFHDKEKVMRSRNSGVHSK